MKRSIQPNFLEEPPMPERIGRALGYALLIWLSGFVWGSVVFMTPALEMLHRYPMFPVIR
jgi:hypothetical protein